jgi:membrane-anchored glycerophosphoryl diester phosphodiesterase (GDPDase)
MVTTYVVVAAVSFLAAVTFVGYQIWRAWTQRRRWAWLNIALMLVVLIGTMILAGATVLTNTGSSGEPLDVVAAVTYVTAMAGTLFWFWGLFGGELIYFLTEHLDKRRIERSEEASRT